jgi:uncharacterized peroxidase-related enzyme
MTFIETVPESGAPDAVAHMYAAARESQGRLPNFVEAFSLRPEVFGAWLRLNGAIKAGMDLRRYELATVAAARQLRSSYCMLAHGSVLVEQFMDSDALREIVVDHRAAGLDPVDVAVMDLAEKVAADAGAVTQADIDRLHQLGLSDTDIFNVVLAAAARCFFTKALDGIGVQADAEYADQLEPELLDALVVGRPIRDAPPAER